MLPMMGFPWFPTFLLGNTAVIINLSAGKGRFSIDPDSFLEEVEAPLIYLLCYESEYCPSLHFQVVPLRYIF